MGGWVVTANGLHNLSVSVLQVKMVALHTRLKHHPMGHACSFEALDAICFDHAFCRQMAAS